MNSGYWSKKYHNFCEILIRIKEVESMTKQSMMQWGAVNKINYWDELRISNGYCPHSDIEAVNTKISNPSKKRNN